MQGHDQRLVLLLGGVLEVVEDQREPEPSRFGRPADGHNQIAEVLSKHSRVRCTGSSVHLDLQRRHASECQLEGFQRPEGIANLVAGALLGVNAQ